MKRFFVSLFILGALTALFLLSLICGAVDIPASEVIAILGGDKAVKPSWIYIVIENRLPQAITSIMAGGGLAITGLMLQTAFRNSLAGPSIFGVSGGSALGVALIMLVPGISFGGEEVGLGGFMEVTAAAFLGAMAVMGTIMLISLSIKNNMMLLIAGIMVGYLTSSGISLLNFFAGAEGVQNYMVWGLGSFSNVTNSQLPYLCGGTLIGLLASLLLIKPLNMMLLGDSYARNLGVNPVRLRNYLLIVTGWLTAIITAYCGPIGFIGLAVPHIARFLFRTDDHSVLMPATIGCGAIIGLLCNIICSLPGDGGLLPLNAVTPIIGAPVIIYVLIRHAKK